MEEGANRQKIKKGKIFTILGGKTTLPLGSAKKTYPKKGGPEPEGIFGGKKGVLCRGRKKALLAPQGCREEGMIRLEKRKCRRKGGSKIEPRQKKTHIHFTKAGIWYDDRKVRARRGKYKDILCCQKEKQRNWVKIVGELQGV